MPLISLIGGTVAISVAAPATHDSTGFVALSWTVIGEVVSHGALKDTAERVSATLLADGRTSTVAGARKADEVPVSGYYSATDAGQDLVRPNVNSATVVSMRFTDVSGHIHYNQGLLMDRGIAEANAGASKIMDFVFVPNKAWVETGG